jgi:hypothetical protein
MMLTRSALPVVVNWIDLGPEAAVVVPAGTGAIVPIALTCGS